jgi:3'-5' exoribonuclease 1
MINYILYDLEATCGWPKEHRQSEIIEIGAVKINEKLEVIDEFQAFVRPKLNPELTPFCMDLTTITQADVDHAKDFGEVGVNFARWCGVSSTSKPDLPFWLCSWGHYDKKQLIQDCSLWNLRTDWITNHISVKHQHGTMIGKANGIGMENALKLMEIPLEGTHHRGIDDARNTAKIFLRVFDQLKFQAV